MEGHIVMTNRTKFFIQWGSIITISFLYIASILVNVLDYGMAIVWIDADLNVVGTLA